MKKILLFLFAGLAFFTARAQDFEFGQLDNAALEMTRYDKDTSAHAVVLKEFGKTWFVSTDKIPLEHDYHVKIKVFDNKGFEYPNVANVSIPIYKSDNESFEEVTEIKGVVYYKDENGLVRKAELDPQKIYHTNENKHWDLIKFALPDVRSGCVLEYSYHLESPFHFNFRNWDFQSEIPKVYSEYEVHIPAIYNYHATLRGFYKLTKNNAELERECFSYYGTKADCSKITYAMADVPAFVEEDYMTSPKNFMSAIYFELMDYTSLQTGVKMKLTKEWKDVEIELKSNETFGSQLKRKELMKERLEPILAGKTDNMSKAKAVYAFIQKNIKWNGSNTMNSDDGIKKALDNHSGSVGDINLALIAGLNAAGINTDAVLLSTRENGIVNKLNPVIGDFNYVIARTEIDGKAYLLDASDPLLGFGMLPMKCINDQGRVISLNKPSYWIDLVAPFKKSATTSLDLTLEENGKLKGTLVSYSMGYEAYETRKAIKKFNSVDEYVENLDEKLSKIKILKSDINGLDSLDGPLSETYQIEIDAYKGLNHDKISFNPFIINHITTNPFKLTERSYPVDWGMPSDERYVLTVHLPEQFKIESAPQDVAFALPNQGGKFITGFSGENGMFTFSHVTQFSKSVYGQTEYPYLKELYNKIVQSEKSEIVFSRK